MENPSYLSIKLYDYRLTESNLDALASEFLGKSMANLEMKNGNIDLEFPSIECRDGFNNALQCFKINFQSDKK